jgi:hypothetical protein
MVERGAGTCQTHRSEPARMTTRKRKWAFAPRLHSLRFLTTGRSSLTLRPAPRPKFSPLRCGHDRINCKGASPMEGINDDICRVGTRRRNSASRICTWPGQQHLLANNRLREDKWIVSTIENESGAYCIGEGATFAEAWHARENQILTRGRSSLKRVS